MSVKKFSLKLLGRVVFVIEVMRAKLDAKELRKAKPSKKAIVSFYQTPIVFVLDNVLDTFNIGSFFRLGDALGSQKIYLGGKVVTPPNQKIHRASVGLWRWLPWEHHRSACELVKKLKKQGYFLLVAEQTKKSQSYLEVKPKFPVAVVVGHETLGVDPKIVKLADFIAEVPLLGVNRSLNVLVAASVVGYHLLSLLP